MKKLFLVLFILVAFKSYSQVYQVLPQYGYEMKRVDPTLVLKVPSDTVNNKTGVARIGTVLYVGNGTYWTAAGGGGGGTDSSLTAGFGLTKTTLGNNISLKVDTSLIATQYGLGLKWGLSGNTITAGQYLGTNNSEDLVLKSGGDEVARFSGDGQYRVAMGYGTTASGDFSTAMGYGTTASGGGSTAMGESTTASGVVSTAMGANTKSKSYGGLTLGTFNDSTNATSPTSYNALNRAFEIGIGQDDANRANAMTVLFNGNVGIGTTTPDSLLTVQQGLWGKRGVRFSGLPTAPGTKALRIDAAGNVSVADTTSGGASGLTVGTTTISGGTSGAIPFNNAGVFGEDAAQLFWDNTNNRLGIGTNSPSVSLDVLGKIRVRQSASVNNIFIDGGNLTASGTNNSAIGVAALSSLTTGANNFAAGFNALTTLSDGTGNMALGTQSLGSLTSGVYNVGIGFQAGFAQTDAPNNVAIGRQALSNNISGNGNGAIGTFALQNTTGNFNTAIGLYSGQNLTSGSYNVAIGSWLDFPAPTANGQLNIGNLLYGTGLYSTAASSSTPVSGGAIGIGVTSPAASAILDVSSTTKGFLPPRMTTTQINAISSPAEGLVVYNTTLSVLCFYDGSGWKKVTHSAM
jgi:Head domain of trimeric autotransporter adhesin